MTINEFAQANNFVVTRNPLRLVRRRQNPKTLPRYAEIDLKNLICETPREMISGRSVERFANLIIQTGALVRPLIVASAGYDNYNETFRVADASVLGYWAARRAAEFYPATFESVCAFIAPPETLELAAEQLLIS